MSVRRSSGRSRSTQRSTKTLKRTSTSLYTDRETRLNDDIDHINDLLRDARNHDDAYGELQLMIDLENTHIKKNQYKKRQMSRYDDPMMNDIKKALDEDTMRRKDSIKEFKQELHKL